VSIGSLIEQTPGVCGGHPRIAGTRVPVHRITQYYRLGYGPEEILNLLNSLSLSQVYAALTYALVNPAEIDQALQEEEQVADQLTPQHGPA
jgi:uncharacterized protein (DUF433 family)